MGATGVYMSMAETKKMILRDMAFTGSKGVYKVIASAGGRGGLWVLREINPFEGDPFVTATFVKMEHRKGETTYKEIDIDMHPYYYDCPQSWLTRIVPQGEMGMEWLERGKKYAHVKIIEIKPGMEFHHNSVDWKVEYKYSAQFWACRTSQGTLYRVKNSSIREALSA